VELIVGALVVLGFLAILTRFLPRDATGGIVLPRIVDDSIGMYVLRRMTGRRLGERPWAADETAEARHVRTAATAVSAADLESDEPVLGPARLGPTPVVPVRSVVSRSQAHRLSEPPLPVVPLRAPPTVRRDQARRRGLVAALPTIGAIAAALAVIAVGAGLLSIVVGPREPLQGDVLGATGTPEWSAPNVAVLPSASPTVDPGASSHPPTDERTAAPTLEEPTATPPTAAPVTPAPPTPAPATAAPTAVATPVRTPGPTPTPLATPGPTAPPTVPPSPNPSNPTPEPSAPAPTPTPSPPIASFEWTVVDAAHVQFHDLSESGVDIVSWSWAVGSVETSTAQNPLIELIPRSDPYEVRLAIVDQLGRASSVTRPVQVP
jgi:hypothetical protein